ncbi:MAG: META domain-containing protein [Acidobacteria bacterium]|nr:META domain-containing protein [Acidobacteriota bacterium]
MIKHLIIATAALFVFGAAADVFAQSASLPGKRWSLTEMNGKPVAGSPAFIEFNEDTKRVSGNATCNRFFGGAAVGSRSMRFSGMGSTRMFCSGLMEAEQDFLNTMKSVTRYRIRGSVLTLFAGRKAVLKFDSMTHDDAPEPRKFGLGDRNWLLDTIGPNEKVAATYGAFINFDPEEKTAGGNTGCNLFGGNYTAEGGKFAFTNTIASLRACVEEDRNTLERRVLEAMESADRIEVFEDRLTLYSGGRVVLVFRGSEK